MRWDRLRKNQRFTPNLETEHGVDAGTRRLDRGISALEGGERLLLGMGRSYRLLRGSLLRGGHWSRICSRAGRCNARGSHGWLAGVLEIGEIAGLFRTRLNGGKRQIHPMLHGAGDAMQLPDELFELFRTAKVQLAVPQKASGQHHQNRQTESERGKYDGKEQGVERCEGLVQCRLQKLDSQGRIPQRGTADKPIGGGHKRRDANGSCGADITHFALCITIVVERIKPDPIS